MRIVDEIQRIERRSLSIEPFDFNVCIYITLAHDIRNNAVINDTIARRESHDAAHRNRLDARSDVRSRLSLDGLLLLTTSTSVMARFGADRAASNGHSSLHPFNLPYAPSTVNKNLLKNLSESP
jgi:hypothetical protein